MKKIEAVVRVEKLDNVIEALKANNAPGLMIERIEGCGRQKGIIEQFRGREFKVDLLPKCKISLVVRDKDVREFIATITVASKTGDIGDGKIFVSPIENAIRIRTGEEDEKAI